MRKILKVAALFAIAALPSAARAEPPAIATVNQERAALAAELLQLSNGTESVDSWKQLLLAPRNYDQCGCNLSPELKAKLNDGWLSAVRDGFNTAEIVSGLETATAESMSVAEMQKLIAFRKTPLGQKLNAVEKAAQARGGNTDQAAFMKRIIAGQKALTAQPQRTRLLTALIKAQGGVRATVDTLINISIGTSLGAAAAAPADRPRPTESEITALIEGMRPSMEKQIGQVVMPLFAEIYETVSDADLKKYLAELNTPHELKWTAVGLEAMNSSLRAEAIKIGVRFAKEIDSQKI